MLSGTKYLSFSSLENKLVKNPKKNITNNMKNHHKNIIYSYLNNRTIKDDNNSNYNSFNNLNLTKDKSLTL